jgi:hypothetical protein
MGRIDYTAILNGTKTVIENDANVRALRATVEIGRAVLTMGLSPHVNIFEGQRDPSTQTIAAGTRQRYLFKWQVVVSAFSAAGTEDAMSQRDELLGYVETALMADRTLNGSLSLHQLHLLGGKMQSQPGDHGFWSQAAIDLAAEVSATI